LSLGFAFLTLRFIPFVLNFFISMVDAEQQLRSIGRFKKSRRPERTSRLGEVLGELMEKRISPRQAKFEAVDDVIAGALPAELRRHCRVEDISAGQLKVSVDSPSYAHELRLCSPAIVDEFQRCCPAARIRKIKVVLGN